MKNCIRIGSRGSQLALWQAGWVKRRLEEWYKGIDVTIERIKTKGDKIVDVPLKNVGGKGLFIKEIEESLLKRRIDIAVHSMKDFPTTIYEGLVIAAISEREDPRDVVISKEGIRLSDLRFNARIGTSSLRRQAQLLNFRSDLCIIQIRGNLDTRIKKLYSEDLDAVIVAAAGVKRMGWEEKISEFLPYVISLPAIGQGALCIEVREDDSNIIKMMERFNHYETSIEIGAERAFLNRLAGGCQVPIAGFGKISNNRLLLEGMIGSIDGKMLFREKIEGDPDKGNEMGIRLAERLLNIGGDEILREVYGGSVNSDISL
ncbi:MAG: hydroxymethylbilane synthase [Nitrospinae bacterium]|nr:hydroxymethylbilane synthase [Nitrospinota bacterium]